MKIYTYRLNNGARVLATFRRKELSPVGYGNQTQAVAKREELLSHGFEAVIRHWNRNRYIELLGLPAFQGQYCCFEVINGKPCLESSISVGSDK